jgi:ElaA protein
LTGRQDAPVAEPAGVQWRCAPFHGLSGEALYDLLRLRSRVFVVEQQCVFLDMDGLDAACLHVLGESVSASGERQLVAATRLVPAGAAFAEASIGRVVTAPEARGGGLGHVLMAESLQQLFSRWGPQPVRIGAQAHLEAFYNRHGFVSDNKPYIEDGIAHIEMIRL